MQLREKVTARLSGRVQKIIRSFEPGHPDKVKIVVNGAEELYREIRVDNTFQGQDGDFVNLKLGEEVEITISVLQHSRIDPVAS